MPWGLTVSTITTLVMLFVNNYYYGLFNQIEHLPIIMRLMEPGYLTNDFFVNVASVYGPRYYYAMLLAKLGMIVPLPILFLTLTIATNIAIGYVTYLASHALGSNKIKSTLASIIVIATTGLSIGASGYLRQNSLEPGLIAIAMCLWGIWLMLKNRIGWASWLFLLAMFFHPSVSLIAASMSYVTYILLNKRGFWHFLLFVGIFLGIWVLPFRQYLSTASLYKIIVYFRNPHHLLPSTFLPSQYMMLGLFSFGVLRSVRKLKKSKVSKFLMIMMCFSFILLVLGYLMVEVFPMRIFIPIQSFRVISLIKWVGTIIIVNVSGIISIAIIFITSIANKGDVLTMIVSILLVYLAHMIGKSRRMISLAVIMLIMIFLVSIDRLEHKEWFNSFRPILTITETQTTEDEVADYAYEKTENEAIFLTPPNWGRFRLRANRAIIVDFKSVPYSEKALELWYERLVDVYGKTSKGGFLALSEFDNHYHKLNDIELLKIAEKYNANYAVLYRDTNTKFTVIFENEDYKLIIL